MISLLLISAEVLQVLYVSQLHSYHGFEPRTDLGGVGDLDEGVPLGNPRLAVGVQIPAIGMQSAMPIQKHRYAMAPAML